VLRSRHTEHAPGARFIDPTILARIKDLELVARTVVDGFISGLHRSPFLGLSIDFAEHRAYMPGDDIRRIDWRVFARTDRFYVKEYEADTNANFSVVLDVSRSMDYQSQGVTKLEYAKFLTASLTYLSMKQRDRVGLITFADNLVNIVPPSAKHFETVLHTLDRLESSPRGEFAGPLLKVAESLNRRSILVIISDLYDRPDAIVEAVNGLRFRGNDVAVFHVLDPAEIAFSFDEAGSFEDLETGERIAIVPDQLREEYQERVRRHRAELSKRFGENRIDYAFFDTTMPLDHALFAYLSNRQRLSRVR
jgi:uncharacterized protein (DUF58 family)